MRKYFLLALILLFNLSNSAYASASISPELRLRIQKENNEFLHSILLVPAKVFSADSLHATLEGSSTPLEQRQRLVLRSLLAFASRQKPEFELLVEKIRRISGVKLELQESYWLVPVYVLSANKKGIEALSRDSFVGSLEANTNQLEYLEPILSSDPRPEMVNGPEAGLLAIKAPFMWGMGYTGHKRKFLSVDTGIWPNHPAIRDHYLGNFQPLSHAWKGFDLPLPGDKSGSHGTHTTGTILGMDPNTADTIGVAFGAYFLSTDPIVSDLSKVRSYTALLSALQWALNPDGDTSTVNDIPDAINNSWGRTPSSADTVWCNSFIGPGLLNLASAGIAVCFSAGNSGPGGGTIGLPATINTSSLVVPFTIGALNGNDTLLPIANFSSRGPSLCGGTGSYAIKPEVSAPGVQVRSSIGQNGYDNYNGTSMACPHTVGAVLLLKEAFPYLSGESICMALYQSATDLGAPGEDNVFGKGIINLQSAFQYLVDAGNTPVQPQARTNELFIGRILNPEAQNTFVCQTNLSPKVLIQNRGNNPITSFRLRFGVDSLSQTLNLTRNLQPGQMDTLALPVMPLHNGLNQIIVTADRVNNGIEYDTINNTRYYRINNLHYSNNQSPTYAFYDFEGFVPDNTGNCIVENPDTLLTWDTVSTKTIQFPYGPSHRSIAMDCKSYSPRKKQLDNLLFGTYSVPASSTVKLSFHWAYRTRLANLKDSLFVDVSTDCGQTFSQRILSMGSLGMRTYNLDTPTDASHFKDTSVLISLGQTSELVFRFQTQNDYGGTIYLDNVMVNTATSVSEFNLVRSLVMFPNPASQSVNIQISPKKEIQNLEMMDAQGRHCLSVKVEAGTSQMELPLEGFSAGVYWIRLVSPDGEIKTGRLVHMVP